MYPNTLHNIINMNSNALGRVLLILDLNLMVSHQTNKEADIESVINWSKFISRYLVNKVQKTQLHSPYDWVSLSCSWWHSRVSAVFTLSVSDSLFCRAYITSSWPQSTGAVDGGAGLALDCFWALSLSSDISLFNYKKQISLNYSWHANHQCEILECICYEHAKTYNNIRL